jgi:hypothetical protein
MNRQFANAVSTTLSAAMLSTDTTMTVASASGFPASYPFDVHIEAETTNTDEIVQVTSLSSGTTYNVTRASEPYGGVQSASAHSSGANVRLVVTAGALAENRPLTTKGDLQTFSGTVPARLPVGADGQVLTADSTQTLGVKWAAGGGGGGGNAPDGKPWNFTPSSSPDTIDDEFGDAVSQSGPVNGLNAKWSKHNMGTPGWLVFDDTMAPGCALFSLPSGQATDQHIYQSFAPTGDFIVACRMMLSVPGDRQMWYLNALDTSGNGIGIGIDTGDQFYLRQLSSWQQSTNTAWSLGIGTLSQAEIYGGLPLTFFLRRASGVYSAACTLGDRFLAPQYTSGAPNAFTLAYLSFGRIYGTGASLCALDFVRRLA